MTGSSPATKGSDNQGPEDPFPWESRLFSEKLRKKQKRAKREKSVEQGDPVGVGGTPTLPTPGRRRHF